MSPQDRGETSAIILTGTPDSLLDDGRTLLRAAWRLDRRRFLLQILFLVFGGVAGGASLVLLIPIVNAVANPDATVSLPVLGEVSLAAVPLWLMLIAFVLLTLAQALIQRAGAINAARFQPQLVDELRHQAFSALLEAKWTFVVGKQRSDIIAIVTAGAARCGLALQQLVQAAITAVLALATAAVSFWVAPGVTAIALVGVLGLAALQALTIRPSYRLGLELSKRSRRLQAVMQDSLDSLRLVRAHHASAIWVDRLSSAFAGTREVQVAQVQRTSSNTAMTTVVLAAAAALLVQVAVWLQVPATSIVILLVLVARLAGQVRTLVGTGAQLANSLPAVRDLAELTNGARAAVEVPPQSQTHRTQLDGNAKSPLIEFQDVYYSYPDSDSGVRGISLTVPRGRITALTGHSGAGKSTTADLALGLLEPDSGQILIDGEPLAPRDLPWWRRYVAYVPQETVLVPSSIRENLTWSVTGGATDEQCWEALDRAGATFARSLPDGLDTVLGDRGLRLSGGERQRVAIARALLRNPALLVLDEATSNLDEESESVILSLMQSLVPAVTLLVIAHRQSTVNCASHVVRLAEGRVLDQMSR